MLHRIEIKLLLVIFGIALGMELLSCANADKSSSGMRTSKIETGNVIFIHPDGSGGSMWGALRMHTYGPDSMSNWDRMEKMGLYRSHLLNSTNSSSNGGATVHSFGAKVNFDTYGNVPENPVKSLSGKDYSIMVEAQKAGMATALINSGHICEPGTGVFVANALKRTMTDTISEQIINSGADIIMSGGETLLLPKGVIGRHGQEGIRKDGKNLIQHAERLDYTIVYTRDELLELPLATEKVLGVFAAKHTFNADPEEHLHKNGLPLYYEEAPTAAEMTEVALNILIHKNKQFLMVVEEEGTDNFANNNNAKGTLEALHRADDAIGVAMNYADTHGNTLVITAADSEAGGMQMIAVRDSSRFAQLLPDAAKNGAPLDGRNGRRSLPFVAAPDQFGTQLRFGISWSCYTDVFGSIISRAHGLNSHLLTNNVDNTDIYRIMYATLFGEMLPSYSALE